MKKLLAILALLVLSSAWVQGAFAANVYGTKYPSCYKGYGSGGSGYNGTNKDRWAVKGWCVDDYGILEPQTGITTNSQYPNSQGGFAVPIVNANTGPTGASGAPVPLATF